MATYVVPAHTVKSAPASNRRPSTTTTTTASSVSANMGPPNTTMPTLSKALEGLEGVPVRIFTTINNMQGAIDSEKLKASKACLYLIFRLVTTDNLLKIERARESGKIDRGVRVTHYADWDILILKVPT